MVGVILNFSFEIPLKYEPAEKMTAIEAYENSLGLNTLGI
jgi:hypothetical protein